MRSTALARPSAGRRRIRSCTIGLLLGLVGCGPDPGGAPDPASAPSPPQVGSSASAPRDAGELGIRLPRKLRAVSYEARLAIDPGQDRFRGQLVARIEIAEATRSFSLHATELDITEASLEGADGVQALQVAESDAGVARFEAQALLPPGPATLRIEYSGAVEPTETRGLFRQVEGDDAYVFTQLEPTDARRVFPCVDEPDSKVPWQLTLEIPDDLVALSNTPVRGETPGPDGRKVVEFEQTLPLPSYLVALAVGPFDVVDAGRSRTGTPIRIAVSKGRGSDVALAVETTGPILALLEDYFGTPYPYAKLDLVGVPLTVGFSAMENAGLVTFEQTLLAARPEDRTIRYERIFVNVTAHELAHQWFGNLVTMRWWNDLWLNESFADWMGDKASVAVYPDFAIELPELRTLFQVMDQDARSTTKPIRHDFKSTDNFEDGVYLSYYKGKAVLGMFEEAVGAEVFRDGVVRYLRKYSRGNAAADDLWAEINAGAEFDLAGGLAGFVNQPGIPLLSVTDKGDGRFEFAQSRLLAGAEPAEPSRWVLPMHYKYALGDRVVTAALVVDDPVELVQLDADVAWIMPSADQRGYYRWSIPDEMLLRLGEDAATHLNVRERMGLLTNLWALLGADKLDGDTYLAAMRGVAKDADPAVISALLDQLSNVQATLITAELREPFAIFLRELLSPTLARIGTATIPGEDSAVTELRAQVLLWLADYGRDETARAVITSLADRYVAGSISASDLAAVALRTAARWGTTETFKAYRERFEPLLQTSPNDRRNYVRAIGSFRDPAVVQQVLDYVLSGKLQPVDISTVLQRLSGWEDNLPMLLDWAMQNDARLRELLPGGSMADAPAMLSGCSTDNLDTIAGFYGAEERFVAGIDGEIKEARGTASECAALRQRELQSVRVFLTQTN